MDQREHFRTIILYDIKCRLELGEPLWKISNAIERQKPFYELLTAGSMNSKPVLQLWRTTKESVGPWRYMRSYIAIITEKGIFTLEGFVAVSIKRPNVVSVGYWFAKTMCLRIQRSKLGFSGQHTVQSYSRKFQTNIPLSLGLQHTQDTPCPWPTTVYDARCTHSARFRESLRGTSKYLVSTGERPCESLMNRWSSLPMHIRNPKRSHQYVAGLVGRKKICVLERLDKGREWAEGLFLFPAHFTILLASK
ncbi:hypothetical protein EVAR_61281_1 [Eumeta japonica]|uniref:Uncharacterized protein n=1 Tax=Eumeta variegata TaxID=151549 RepID=A0A4C1XHW6_EUMVA|nr:hypothetical protein EVAR_61281_1 [Eumeta japonica]